MPRLTAILVLPVIFCLTLGAAIDRAAEEKKVAARRSYWAFQAPQAAPVPNQADPWVRTAIDAFILRSLRAKDLRPSPPASRHTLLRRLYLDLTGLPPTPEQAREFLADPAPDAYEKLVEKLLASPHYGERWGLRWLDVVRYADSNGFELDAERPEAWRYRDYVIASFNSDKPYDRFLQEQIAGDELFPESRQALIATGFHRTGPIHIVGGNQDEEMNRQEVLTEMTTAVGASFLGMTVHCARCHDHKFDPILQSDYYRLQAVLAATEFTDVPMAPEAEWAAFLDNKRKFDDRMNPILNALKELEKPYREQAEAAKKAALSAEHRRALEKPEDRRTPDQKRLAKEAKAQIKPTWDEVVALIAGARKERRQDLRRRMHALELERPSPPARAYAVANKTMDPPVTHILKVGDHKKKLDPVEPGFPTVFPDLGIEMPVTAQGRRAALAKWLTHPDHPLTARVMVNRIWQFRMGHGLVDTPNDFGLLGANRPRKNGAFEANLQPVLC